MTLIEDLAATNDVAMAVTSALEQVLGDDVILAVGVAQRQAPTADLLPEGATRSVSLPLTGSVDGEIGLIVSDQLATCSKRAPPTRCSRRVRPLHSKPARPRWARSEAPRCRSAA